MRHLCTALLAGVAIVGTTAFASQAVAAQPDLHKMTVALPGGGSEIIEYTGAVAPKVTLTDTPFYSAWAMPMPFGAFAPGPDFAAFNHWAANLDRRMDAVWNHMAMMGGKTAPTLTALQNLGPGSAAYSVVSQSSGNNFCAHMTTVTIPANGGKPKVVTRTSGNCGALHAHGTLSAAPFGVGVWSNDMASHATASEAMRANAPGVMTVAMHVP